MRPAPEAASRKFDIAFLMPGTVAFCLIVLVLRLWYLQIAKGEELSRLAVQRRTIHAAIPSPRGQVLDRQGRLIAGVKPSLTVMVTPAKIRDDPLAIKRLAAIIGEDPAELQAHIEENTYRRHLPFAAKVGIAPAQAISVEENRAFLPGVSVMPHSLRTYPKGAAFAHALGYVGGLTEEDQKRIIKFRKDLPSFAGKVGIERRYDIELMGKSGSVTVEVDARGRQLSEPISDPPTPGDKLVLSLDADLQQEAMLALGGHKGSVVAIEPKTGQVLCLFSSPSFDPNMFARRITAAEWRSLQNDPNLPLHNRAVGSAFAPGSTFKVVTLIAAVRAGVVSPGTTFVCDGSIRLGDRTFRCLGNHGRINYETAIEKSCNVFFAELGRRLKREQIVEVAAEFGFGTTTGVDIGAERTGLIPDDEWLRGSGRKWYVGDTVNLCIGQGYLLVTPIQMASYAAAIANRGFVMRPHILQSRTVTGTDGKPEYIKPELTHEAHLDALWWDRIVSAMKRVVNTGTGTSARIEGVAFAGKTGSADVRQGERAHAWFIGFAPAEDPRIAIAVVLESAGRGGEEAAPVAKAVVERYLKRIGPN